jgi:membrane fusion protein (multidrug efflux system)
MDLEDMGALLANGSCSLAAVLAIVAVFQTSDCLAQQPPNAPVAVGVARVEKKPITQTSEFIGRILAINRVDIVARVTAFLEHVNFQDGAEVKKGDVLYRLERGPFEADLQAKEAVVAQMNAQLQNAQVALERAQSLLRTQAGAQATVDSALASQRSYLAQLLGAKANVKSSQINLDYTEISSPIDGKIGRTAVTPGNVVTPNSATLVTVVGQDPMYVLFPVAVRTLLDLRAQYADKGGYNAVVIRVRLPDGHIYDQPGKLEFVDNTVQTATDTVLLRGTLPNPETRKRQTPGAAPLRELQDNQFVSVLLEGVQPVEVLAIPRAAVLTDQQSDFVYVVNAENNAQRQNIKLGQSTPAVASVISGLKEGELVIVEGLQRVRPGAPVSPRPMTPGPVVPPEHAAAPTNLQK